MWYLFIQTWLWILGAGLFGLFIGWLIWRRKNTPESSNLEELERELRECRSNYAKLEAISKAREENKELSARTAIEVPREQATQATQAAQADLIPAQLADDPVDETKNTQHKRNGEETLIDGNWKPVALSSPDGEADDLKRVKGIGPVIERKLNALGIYHFSQVGAFTEENIRWVNHHIAFPGRIQREDWVAQAKKLAQGEGTDFSDRYDNN